MLVTSKHRGTTCGPKSLARSICARVVERTLTWLTLAWLNRNRRLAKDFEASIASAKAWLIIASV
jgi:hypothetical protein